MKSLFQLVYQSIICKNYSKACLHMLWSIIYFKRSMLKSPAISYGKAFKLKCSMTSLMKFSNFWKFSEG